MSKKKHNGIVDFKDFSMFKVPSKYIMRYTKEDLPGYRTEFMRDRDRILYSRAFRRLSNKTQVFLSGYLDHIRTRLTHSLEVAQIAKTITANLGLDENLAEAISLGHDLGHTPFGHIGEKILNIILNGCESFTKDLKDCEKGFKHNLQSVRVAVDLEGDLNLTKQTLFGLYNHTDDKWKSCSYKRREKCCFFLQSNECNRKLRIDFYKKYLEHLMIKKNNFAWSFEAFIVEKSDEIAQRHHDIEDALDSKIISVFEAKKIIKEYFGVQRCSMNRYSRFYYDKIQSFIDFPDQKSTYEFIKDISRFIVNILVEKLIKSSMENLEYFKNQYRIETEKQFEEFYPKVIDISEVKKIISFDPINGSGSTFAEIVKGLKEHLNSKILNSYPVQQMDGKGRFIIRRLFKAYLTNPQQLPDKTIITLVGEISKAPRESENDLSILVGEYRRVLLDCINSPGGKKVLIRTIADYIAGMTDLYALRMYERLYG